MPTRSLVKNAKKYRAALALVAIGESPVRYAWQVGHSLRSRRSRRRIRLRLGLPRRPQALHAEVDQVGSAHVLEYRNAVTDRSRIAVTPRNPNTT